MSLSKLWQRIEEGTKRLAAGKKGLWGLAVAGFLESSIVPFPIELFLVPAYLSHRDRAWRLATAALVGCLAASATFYALGALFTETLSGDLARMLGVEDRLGAFAENLEDRNLVAGFWLIFSVSLLPLPLQAATLGSGAFGYPFFAFLGAIFASRFIRFHGLAALTLLIGRRLESVLEGRSYLWRVGALLGAILLVILLSVFALRSF